MGGEVDGRLFILLLGGGRGLFMYSLVDKYFLFYCDMARLEK